MQQYLLYNLYNMSDIFMARQMMNFSNNATINCLYLIVNTWVALLTKHIPAKFLAAAATTPALLSVDLLITRVS